MSLEIIRPRPEHFDGILKCLYSYRLQPLGMNDRLDEDYPKENILQVRNVISHVRLEEKTWIAVLDGEVIGTCGWAWYNEAEKAAKTKLIAVLPEARSSGAGRALQERRVQEMKEHGARCVHTWSDHPASIEWYKSKFGYKEIGRDPIYHAIHRFTLGDRDVWTIHRAFPESENLAHMLLEF